MELSKERIESLRELLAPANRKIVIVAHTNPDGDAVGSSLAWAEVLRGMGHEVTCIVPNKYPYFLDWMPGIGQVVVFKNDTAGDAVRAIAEADLLFCLDFNAVSRLEILSDTIEANTTARRVLIDQTVDLTATLSAEDMEALILKQMSNDQLNYAMIIFTTAPIIAAYPFLQRYFVKGVMVGSLKG